jgi:hypothetical protein
MATLKAGYEEGGHVVANRATETWFTTKRRPVIR